MFVLKLSGIQIDLINNMLSYENNKAQDEEGDPENSDDWNILERLKQK